MTIKDIPEQCACGKPMHLKDSQKLLISMNGKNWPTERKVISISGKVYLIPTYYIILHGLHDNELSRFKEIPPAEI